MFKISIKFFLFFLVVAVFWTATSAAFCDNGVCYKECGIGYKNSFGDFEIGWCYTKNSKSEIALCNSDKDCNDSLKCMTKCIV